MQTYFDKQKTRLLPMLSLSQVVTERDARIAQLEQRIADLQNSASWKLMSPLRVISGKVKALLS
ncbi:MAG: hypothetical protein IPH40_09720 [Polaromonas sp.]|nr:hypothetical protein [Polaromonas sp.]